MAHQLDGFGVMVIFSKIIVYYSLNVLSVMCAGYMFWNFFLSDDTRLKAVRNVGIYKLASFTFCTFMRCSL